MGGGALHPAPPLLAGRWPAGNSRAPLNSVVLMDDSSGGASAPPHPPRAPLERFAIWSPNLNNNKITIIIINGNDNNRIMLGGGAPAPPAPPRAPLERFALSVVIMDDGGGGALPPRTPPAGRPSAGGESRALCPTRLATRSKSAFSVPSKFPPLSTPFSSLFQ